MRAQLVEATNGPMNWGKFLVGTFDGEWAIGSEVSPDFGPLLKQCGWGPLNVLVLDLQTREGAIFYPHPSRSAKADLDKHRIWVCPLFEPFLEWLYANHERLQARLPAVIDLPDAPFEMRGYRRTGRGEEEKPQQ